MSSIALYTNNSSPETVDKNITSLGSLTGDYRGSVNILSPVIQVTPSGTLTVAKILTECNYAYITETGRYYFVTGITAVANDLIELELRVDVLMSWKTQILAQSVIVSRNEKEYQLYLDDSALKVFNNPNICTYNFYKEVLGVQTKTGFTAKEFVLALAGS